MVGLKNNAIFFFNCPIPIYIYIMINIRLNKLSRMLLFLVLFVNFPIDYTVSFRFWLGKLVSIVT